MSFAKSFYADQKKAEQPQQPQDFAVSPAIPATTPTVEEAPTPAQIQEALQIYRGVLVPVHTPHGVIICRTYQYSDLEADAELPSPHYKLVIVEGAKEHKLPEDYIRKLESIPDNGFKGSVDVDIPLLAKLNVKTEM